MNLQSIMVHQTVHGYMHGHELLAASTELATCDADRLAQLSDLSGYPVAPSFQPYLTCYPLPSQKYYAFACTWFDDEAPRDGCVLTHTLLVPMDAWKNADVSAQQLSTFLRRPNRAGFDEFCRAIEVFENSDSIRAGYRPEVQRIAGSYFLNGQPLVILTAEAELGRDILPAFLDLIWPALRARFSGCTYALQPRQIGNSQFDLQFAPAAALSKYSRVPECQIIRSAGELLSIEDSRVERLIELVNSEWFGEGKLASYFGRDLWDNLPPDPTALHRLVIFDDLVKRSEHTSSSSIAALDVLGGIFPSPTVAVDAKEQALKIAIQRAMSQPLASRLEYLASIALRCSKSSFGTLRKLRRDLVTEITRISIDAPESALEAMSRSKGRNAPLFSGIGRGIPSWNIHDHESLGEFGDQFPAQIESLLRYAPEVAPSHLMAMDRSNLGFERGIANVLSWYDRSRLYVRGLIGKSIVETELFSRNEALVGIAVEHAGVRQLDLVFSALLKDPHGVWHLEHGLEALVKRFPEESRESILGMGIQTDLAADLFVQSLQCTLDGLNLIESLGSIGHLGYSKVTAAFVRNLPDLNSESHQIEERSEAWLKLWLDGESAPSKHVLTSARILLRRFDNLDISLRLSAKKNYYFEFDDSFASLLGESILRSIVHAYLSSRMSQDDLISWLRNVLISKRVQSSEDLGLNKRIHNSYSSGVMLWRYIRLVGEETGASQRKFEPLCTWLFGMFKPTWDRQMTSEWKLILAYLQRTSRQVSRCEIDALNTALDNPNLPLVEIVAQTFARVYLTTAPKASRTFFEMMWASVLDPGLNLRKKLVFAFRNSNWPPASLAEIALDAEIADLVFREVQITDQQYFTVLTNEMKHNWADRPNLHKLLRILDQINR